MTTSCYLSNSVATVNTQISTGNIVGCVGQQERDWAHQVLGRAHLTLRNQRGPLLLEVWVVVHDALGQDGEHVAGRDAVDANTDVSPLDGERGSEVADSGLGGVVGTVGIK